MSKLSQNTNRTGDLAAVLARIETRLNEQGSAMTNKTVGELMISQESLTDEARDALDDYSNKAHKLLKDTYFELKISTEEGKYTDAQWEAGAVILAAGGAAGRYARNAMTVLTPKGGDENVTVIDSLGSSGFDYRGVSAHAKASMEAFDDRELAKSVPFSAVFNIQAARQDEFGETFYPTTVITPDQVGLEISCRRTMVFNETRHENTGKPTDFGRRHLVEGVVDYKLLESEATLAVPVFIVGNTENNAKFTATADLPTHTRVVNGESVVTSALKPGVELDLIGLSQTAATLATGQMDVTDSLDVRVVLENVYLKIHGATANAGAGVTSVFKLDTSTLPLSQFQKSAEGADRQVNLNFTTVDLVLTKDTKTVAGVAAASSALEYLTAGAAVNYVVRLAVDVNGRANLELGSVKVTSSPVTVDSVWEHNPTDGSYSKVTGSAFDNLVAEFDAISLIGYDLIATRSNINRRTRGLMVSVLEIVEKHSIPLGAPITCPNPVTATRTAADLAAPIQAARIRNSNNAVTKLLRYKDTLSSLHISTDRSQPVPNVEGLGRLVLRPFYEELDLDLAEVTSSVKSSDRAEDVSAALINAIRDISYRMYRNSAYQAALDAQTGGTGEKPWLYIGTDQYTHRHLIVPGDTRTASIGFEHKIVTSPDARVYGQIFLTFGRPNQPGPDILSFGCMAWMPELATTIQITRNGSTTIETMVQPRTLHVNTCPLLAVINVKNLDIAVADQMPILTKSV